MRDSVLLCTDHKHRPQWVTPWTSLCPGSGQPPTIHSPQTTVALQPVLLWMPVGSSVTLKTHADQD